MIKFKIYAGLKRPYASLYLVDEKEFLTVQEANSMLVSVRERFIVIMSLMILLL